MKNNSVCFSGHRPQKLPVDKISQNLLKSRLYKAVIECVDEGFSDFYTGCALGADMWAAQIVIELKKDNPDIKLHCVIPYDGHSKNWSAADKYNFSCILDSADSAVCLSEKYHAGCFRVRNQYLVDNSSLLIAVVKDMHSGTGQTIRYAEKRGVKILKILYADKEFDACE